MKCMTRDTLPTETMAIRFDDNDCSTGHILLGNGILWISPGSHNQQYLGHATTKSLSCGTLKFDFQCLCFKQDKS